MTRTATRLHCGHLREPAEGSKYYIYGGRGALSDGLAAGGGHGCHRGKRDQQLSALRRRYRLLPGKTLVKAEYVNTRGLFDINNTYAAKDGEGWSVNVESQP